MQLAKIYYAYILECADGSLYSGSTNNLKKRLVEHNTSKRGAHYTKIRRPVKLVFCVRCKNLSLARKEEARWKRMSRKEKLELVACYNVHTDKVGSGNYRI